MKDKLLIKVGSPNYPTVYKLGSFKGKKNLDIRKYYIEKSTGELAPTKKGISLNKESFAALSEILKNQQHEINEWLNSQEILPSDKLLKNLKNQDNRKEKLTDNSFFRIEYNGDKRTIILNENHILSQYLDENIKDEKFKKIINLMLLSFQHTVDLYDDDQKFTVNDFITDLRDNWSTVLKNYINKIK